MDCPLGKGGLAVAHGRVSTHVGMHQGRELRHAAIYFVGPNGEGRGEEEGQSQVLCVSPGSLVGPFSRVLMTSAFKPPNTRVAYPRRSVNARSSDTFELI